MQTYLINPRLHDAVATSNPDLVNLLLLHHYEETDAEHYLVAIFDPHNEHRQMFMVDLQRLRRLEQVEKILKACSHCPHVDRCCLRTAENETLILPDETDPSTSFELKLTDPTADSPPTPKPWEGGNIP